MIFQRSLLREFTVTGIASFLVLLAITITTQLIRFLGYAARGSISSDAVLTFLGFASLRYLPHLLSITLFISVLITLTRSYRDSEMVVWFTSGQECVDSTRPDLRDTRYGGHRGPEPVPVSLGDGKDRTISAPARKPGRHSRDLAGRVQRSAQCRARVFCGKAGHEPVDRRKYFCALR
jgi:hypothetical protein